MSETHVDQPERLLPPSNHTVVRLKRVALTRLAVEKKVGFLDLEEQYQSVSRLLTRVTYTNSVTTPFGDDTAEVVDAAVKFLTDRGMSEADVSWARKFLVRGGERARAAAEAALEQAKARRTDVVEYLEIIEAFREAFLAEGFDLTKVVDVHVYAQAKLIVGATEDPAS